MFRSFIRRPMAQTALHRKYSDFDSLLRQTLMARKLEILMKRPHCRRQGAKSQNPVTFDLWPSPSAPFGPSTYIPPTIYAIKHEGKMVALIGFHRKNHNLPL
jgi:hypothetical protein